MVDMKITLLVFLDFLSVYYFTGIIDWLSTGGTRTMGYAMRLAVCRPEAHRRVRDFEHTCPSHHRISGTENLNFNPVFDQILEN
jgi:hypothetical protein